MFRSYRLGKMFGIPVRVNMSFLLLLGAIFMWMGGLAGVLVALLAFGSVILHELGHALTARRLGVGVSDITLHFFGGAAQMTESPRSPNDEIAIAAAGPAVSFMLAGAAYGLAALTGFEVFVLLAIVNVGIGAFNLLPAFPSDGGRILRALLARRRGYVPATNLAVRIGRYVLGALIVLALATQNYQLIPVAAVLWMMGTAEAAATRLRGAPGGYRSGTAEPPEVVYIPPPPARGPTPGARRPVVFVWRP
jgi:Zn-dependent protease